MKPHDSFRLFKQEPLYLPSFLEIICSSSVDLKRNSSCDNPSIVWVWIWSMNWKNLVIKTNFPSLSLPLSYMWYVVSLCYIVVAFNCIYFAILTLRNIYIMNECNEVQIKDLFACPFSFSAAWLSDNVITEYHGHTFLVI